MCEKDCGVCAYGRDQSQGEEERSKEGGMTP